MARPVKELLHLLEAHPYGLSDDEGRTSLVLMKQETVTHQLLEVVLNPVRIGRPTESPLDQPSQRLCLQRLSSGEQRPIV